MSAERASSCDGEEVARSRFALSGGLSRACVCCGRARANSTGEDARLRAPCLESAARGNENARNGAVDLEATLARQGGTWRTQGDPSRPDARGCSRRGGGGASGTAP